MNRYPCLAESFLGLTAEEDKIAGTNRELYQEEISKEKLLLRGIALLGIIKRAEEGHMDAVGWLETHGWIEWPGKE